MRLLGGSKNYVQSEAVDGPLTRADMATPETPCSRKHRADRNKPRSFTTVSPEEQLKERGLFI